MPAYNKLVRDRIPEIIESTGKSCKTEQLSNEQYTEALKEKLIEEMTELMEAESTKEVTEEAADLLEVVYAFARVHGVSFHYIERARQVKKTERGGFDKRLRLLEVSDES